MKSTISALLILMISSASFARKVAEGKTFTSFGNYRVETAEKPLVVNGAALDTYVVTYDNSDTKITIGIEKDKKCRRFITISGELSVQYVCNDIYFGVEKLDKEYAKFGMKTDDSAMNRSAYFHQKVLTRGHTDPVTCMKLISAYFPDLITAEDKSLPAS